MHFDERELPSACTGVAQINVKASGDIDRVARGEVGHECFERSARAVGARPGDGDCCEQRVLPVQLDPVRHFVEQIRFESSMNCERGENRVLDASMLLASEVDFGQVRRQQISVDERTLALGASDVECVGGEFHEHFAGEGVVSHVEVGDLGCELVGVVTSGETDEESPQRLDSVVVGGFVHFDKLRNRRLRESRDRLSQRTVLSASTLAVVPIQSVRMSPLVV